jgi:hypothetical protein
MRLPAVPPLRTVQAQTHIREFGATMSAPSLFIADDGREYVLKAATPHVMRALIAEQIVPRLGTCLGAPCFEVVVANVPDELIAATPALSRYQGKPAHGCTFVNGLIEVRGIAHENHPKNRARYASLFVLYSWTVAADHQFLHEVPPPHVIYSHDHGLFFPGMHGWNVGLVSAAHAASPDPRLVSLGFTKAELETTRIELAAVSDADISAVVNSVPPAWGATSAELDALSTCLIARRVSLLQYLSTL